MKIFKELKKLGYIHYSTTTIEELDDLPLNSAERISEQALVLRWFREKYGYYISAFRTHDNNWGTDLWLFGVHKPKATVFSETYEEAELACLIKLIEVIKSR